MDVWMLDVSMGVMAVEKRNVHGRLESIERVALCTVKYRSWAFYSVNFMYVELSLLYRYLLVHQICSKCQFDSAGNVGAGM